MKVSDHILGVIKLFEGYTPIAKQLKGDKKGIITGGYGTIVHPDGSPVKIGDPFTREYALHCLVHEVNKKCVKLNKVIGEIQWLPMQNQFDALACFIYNVGDGNLDVGTTMGNALRTLNQKNIADAFLVYTKGTTYILGIPVKKELPGLVARRRAEREMFLHGDV